MTKLNRKSDNITVEGRRGTWYVVDVTTGPKQKPIFILESEIWGHDANWIHVDEEGKETEYSKVNI